MNPQRTDMITTAKQNKTKKYACLGDVLYLLLCNDMPATGSMLQYQSNSDHDMKPFRCDYIISNACPRQGFAFSKQFPQYRAVCNRKVLNRIWPCSTKIKYNALEIIVCIAAAIRFGSSEVSISTIEDTTGASFYTNVLYSSYWGACIWLCTYDIIPSLFLDTGWLYSNIMLTKT